MNPEITNDTNSQSGRKKSTAKAKSISLWILQALLAFAFFGAGFGKLSGQPMMVEEFDKLGLGQWFRYFTGAIELSSAILLLVPCLTFVGSSLLVCTMTCAVAAHLLKLGGSPVPPLVLLTLCGVVAWGRFGDSKKLFFSANPAEKQLAADQSKEKCEF